MKLCPRSGLKDVAQCVAGALSGSGISFVLSGGACATLYTGGKYQSADLDFILCPSVPRRRLDLVMKKAGFERRGNQYYHPAVPFFVEFPAGPLGIGADLEVRPVTRRVGKAAVRMLSPTDCCRDRLAAFYHWGDRQALTTAVQVALRHAVDFGKVRRWSRSEGASAGYAEFLRELRRARRPHRKRSINQ